MTAEPVELQAGIYLQTYLRPFAQWLELPDVTEILVNRPGEVWVERAGQPSMARIEAPGIDATHLKRLATQIARFSHQGVNRENPLLAASLPSGERVQMVAPPATRQHWALAIRRHVMVDLTLDTYGRTPLRDRPAVEELDPGLAETDLPRFLRDAVRLRRTILVSGGTSSGKTTFLNALLKEVPANERIITVEDAPEVSVAQPNALGLIAVKGELGEARVDVDDLLQAALRLRPDRIIVGEVRGPEAVTFLRAINTGHPGSFTTVHANTPQGALEQLALMVMQAGLPMSRHDTIDYVSSLVDIVVQLTRAGGERRIAAVHQLSH